MLLDALLSNEQNKAALVRLGADGRLPHAIILEGERGSGRFTLARLISAMAVCRRNGAGCGECPDCKMALEGQHPDVEVFAKSGGQGTLTIKSLRTINQSVATPPNQGRRRVVILRDIQDIAQARTLNTLLKVIEEPPEYLMFIITVDNRENLLPTILSRCLLLRMELPSPEECAGRVQELLKGGADAQEAGRSEEALRMARLCGGNIGRTAQLLSDTPEARVMADALALSKALIGHERYGALRLLQRYERDRAGYRELLCDLRVVFSQLVEQKYQPQDEELSALSQRMTALQGIKILDIIDDMSRTGQFNLNLPLTLTRLGARLTGAILG